MPPADTFTHPFRVPVPLLAFRLPASARLLFSTLRNNMSTKLYIGGLSWNTDTDGLRGKFTQFGSVEDAIVIRDRETGRSRGFGFVTFSSEAEADAAITQMDNQDFDGRRIRVAKASERDPSAPRGDGFRPFGGAPREGGFRQGGDREGGFRASRY